MYIKKREGGRDSVYVRKREGGRESMCDKVRALERVFV